MQGEALTKGETQHARSCPTSGSKNDKGEVFAALMHLAVSRGIIVRFAPLQFCDGRLKGNKLAIRQSLTIDEINCNLAHEIAHVYLHYDKDTINTKRHNEYEEQADRAAKMLLDILRMEE